MKKESVENVDKINSLESSWVNTGIKILWSNQNRDGPEHLCQGKICNMEWKHVSDFETAYGTTLGIFNSDARHVFIEFTEVYETMRRIYSRMIRISWFK